MSAKSRLRYPRRVRRKPARVRAEFAAFDCGDERLNVRGRAIAAARLAQPGLTDGGASDDGAERAGSYRWMNNKRITPDAVLAAHRPALTARVSAEPDVLVIGDTSDCPFHTRHAAKGLGPLSGADSKGMLAHVTYVTTPQRLPLGVLDAMFLVRDPDGLGKRNDPEHHRSVIAERESRKWEHSVTAAAGLRRDVGAGPRITVVFDREGDIARILCRAAAESADYGLIVRGKNDRRVADAPDQARAFTQLLARPAQTQFALLIPAAPGRPERTAKLELRYAPVRLRATRERGPAGTRPVPECDVWAVMTHEIDAPADVEPLHWRLYTTRALTTAEDARAVVRDYAARWDIEVLFRTWKQALRTLDRRYRTATALQTSLMMDLILAFVILQVAHLRRHRPKALATAVFDVAECDALRRFRREPDRHWPPTLAAMCDAVAALGGYAGRKHPAGAGTMARGLYKLAVITETVQSLLG